MRLAVSLRIEANAKTSTPSFGSMNGIASSAATKPASLAR